MDSFDQFIDMEGFEKATVTERAEPRKAVGWEPRRHKEENRGSSPVGGPAESGAKAEGIPIG